MTIPTHSRVKSAACTSSFYNIKGGKRGCGRLENCAPECRQLALEFYAACVVIEFYAARVIALVSYWQEVVTEVYAAGVVALVS